MANPEALTERDRYMRRLAALRTERTSFDSHYKNLAQFISPRRGRFNRGERNKGGRHFWNNIINSHATWALRVATAGMFNGIISPSRPWLALETDDPDASEFGPAKQWFYIVQEQMRRIFNATNLYNMAPVMLREQLLFGTGCMSDVDDLSTLSRYYAHTVGSYFLAQSDDFKVDTVYREMERTVAQIVKQFSTRDRVNPAISRAVRDQYDRGNYDSWYPLVHVVEPNRNSILGSLRSEDREYKSVYFEPGNDRIRGVLSRRGFSEFPFYCPRWDVTNEDVYGTDCPGMTALGDVRQLQLEEKRKAQAIDKMVNPPLHGPASLRNQQVNMLPAGGTFYDAPGQQNILQPIHKVEPRLQEMAVDLERTEQRINRAFYVDLFLAISDMKGVQPRNQLELMQRNQERLLQLGPTLEREFGEFLDPLISRTFNKMVRASTDAKGNWRSDAIIPPPPPVLQGRKIKPRYISTLAMAQQAISTGNIDRLVQFVEGLAQIFPDVADKFDADQAVDEYASMIGAPARLVVADDIVAKLREQRQKQQQAAQQLQLQQMQANVGKMQGDTKLRTDTLAGQRFKEAGGQPVPAK